MHILNRAALAMPDTLREGLYRPRRHEYSPLFRGWDRVMGAWPSDRFLLQPPRSPYCTVLSMLNSFQMAALRQRRYFHAGEMKQLFRAVRDETNHIMLASGGGTIEERGSQINYVALALEGVLNQLKKSGPPVRVIYDNALNVAGGVERYPDTFEGSFLTSSSFLTGSVNFEFPGTSYVGESKFDFHAFVVPWLDIGARVLVVSDQWFQSDEHEAFFAHAYDLDDVAAKTQFGEREFKVMRLRIESDDDAPLSIAELMATLRF